MKIGLVYRNRGLALQAPAVSAPMASVEDMEKGGYAKKNVGCYDPNTRTRGLGSHDISRTDWETTGTLPLDSINEPANGS